MRLKRQEDGKALDFKVGNHKDWLFHDNDDVDVAVTVVNFDPTKDLGIEWINESETLTLGGLMEQGVSEGDLAYVVGFPLAIVGVETVAPIVRSAIISRIQDTLAGHSSNFLIDSAVFPGNSGGPCLLVPFEENILGGVEIGKPRLIGLVSAYVPYHDVAVSKQTGEARVIFTEHSGLSNVVPFDSVEETVIACAIQHGLTDLIPGTTDYAEEWDTESFLAKLGYSVKKGGPSRSDRRKILRKAVRGHGLEPVARHIAWLIRSSSSRSDSDRYRQAIKKWSIDFKLLRSWYAKSDESFWWPSTE